MDLGPLINAAQQIINWGLNELHLYLGSFTGVQWLLLASGILLVIVGVAYAWRSHRMASYKLSVWVAKLGLTCVVLSFAWPYAINLYNAAAHATGNPVVGIMAVLAGGFLGYNVVKLLFKKKKVIEA